MLILKEHKSSSYAPRTYYNASQGVTLAVAVDHNTAGERCTQKAANGKIVCVQWGTPYIEAARALYKMLRKHRCHTVNVAGNGIYTFREYGISQEHVNLYLLNILKQVHEHWPIKKIVSGGQTGADTAGLVVGVVLGIDTEAMYPKGYKMRYENGKDVECDPEQIMEMIMNYAEKLDD